MSNSEKIIEEKRKINDELKSKELTKLMIGLFFLILLSGIFGYIGYAFCKANQLDAQKGMVFGALFPIGLGLLNAMNLEGKFSYIVCTIVYIIMIQYVPNFIGIIILFLIIFVFIVYFISVVKRDRTDEVNQIYKTKQYKPMESITYTTKKQYIPQTVWQEENRLKELEQYQCERCFKEISEEEYDLYDGMCEECFDESHCDFNGNPREDYWNY